MIVEVLMKEPGEEEKDETRAPWDGLVNSECLSERRGERGVILSVHPLSKILGVG